MSCEFSLKVHKVKKTLMGVTKGKHGQGIQKARGRAFMLMAAKLSLQRGLGPTFLPALLPA